MQDKDDLGIVCTFAGFIISVRNKVTSKNTKYFLFKRLRRIELQVRGKAARNSNEFKYKRLAGD